jgi:hypothetical protein
LLGWLNFIMLQNTLLIRTSTIVNLKPNIIFWLQVNIYNWSLWRLHLRFLVSTRKYIWWKDITCLLIINISHHLFQYTILVKLHLWLVMLYCREFIMSLRCWCWVRWFSSWNTDYLREVWTWRICGIGPCHVIMVWCLPNTFSHWFLR